MSILHKALESLGPRDWDDVPHADQVKSFLRDTFKDAELIVNTVPQPPGGHPFTSSAPTTFACTHPNAANSAAEVICSAARGPDPSIPDLDSLQKGWGKPVKLSAKDNPLGISVWKMAGHDRHGAWFARRSVHEGVGFAKWRKAMQREFAESLAVDGGPGEGSVRGIGADRRLEREITDIGKLEVYQLSAQFPGPVAPREFVTCLLTSQDALSEVSAVTVGGSKHIPRHYMVVSIPVDHPDAPIRPNLVRGSYESVEIIREVPLTPQKSMSTPNLHELNSAHQRSRSRGLTVSVEQSDTHSDRHDIRSRESDSSELNPVEWIMITRSDPGGGIPRFMVERNTPASITADAAKFLNWATQQEDIPDPDHDLHKQEHAQEQIKKRQSSASTYNPAEANGHLAGINVGMEGTFEPSRAHDSGLIASLTSTVQSYVPHSVSERLGFGGSADSQHGRLHDFSDSDSDDSFDSFPETTEFQTAYEGARTPDPMDSTSDLSGLPDDSSGMLSSFEQSSDHRHYERELAKLAQRRQTLEDKMEKARAQGVKKQEELQTKEEREQGKQKEKMEREKRKQEERYKKEMEKLQHRKEREERKIEEKRRKARDKDAVTREKRDKDEYKRRIEILQRENELLRRQLGDLQRENTLLVQKVGKLSQGQTALTQVREELSKRSGEFERTRARSLDSKRGSEKTRSSEVLGQSPLRMMSPRASMSEDLVGGQK